MKSNLHIITALFRPELLPQVYASIPKHRQIIWHIVKTSRTPKLTFPFIKRDERIRIYEIDCHDGDIITKMNTVFDNIRSGQFHILDDDTLFYEGLYAIYKKHCDFDGMIIGKQYAYDMTLRLRQAYPIYREIDTGNVICHSSILRQLKWKDRDGFADKNCKDYIFWDDAFKIFGKDRTILVPEFISIYNKLRLDYNRVNNIL